MGQVIEGPNGLSLTIERLDDEVLVMEARYPGDGALPPEHFEVADGTLRAVIAGSEHRFEQGETFEVPAGTPHQMGAETPARFRWEVRPALRTAEFFERLYSGDPGPDFLEDFSEEVRFTGG